MSIDRGARESSDVASKEEGRRFALTLTAGFLFVAALAYWKGTHSLAGVSATLAVISFFGAALVPGRLEPVRKAWMHLGEAIGKVTTPVLLAIVYYGLVTPIGLMRRLVRGLHRSSAEHGWYHRPPLPPRERLERQF